MPEVHAPWLLALPVLVGLALVWLRPQSHGALLGADGPWGDLGRAWRLGASRLPALFRVGAVVALAWLAAAPFRRVPAPVPAGEGVAVMVVLDLSESMGDPWMEGAGQGGPRVVSGVSTRTKLDVALAELERFVARREGDALGLVVFGGEAVVRVPPTVDRRAFRQALTSLRPGALGEGTAVGTALGMAANRLRALDARSKVVVLLTDGRSNAGALDPVTAARAAAGVGQKVYVLEVEDAGASPPLLVPVARAGNGRHFLVSGDAGLEEAYREIDALEPSRLPGSPASVPVPASLGLLWWAGAFLLVERTLLGSRLGRIP